MMLYLCRLDAAAAAALHDAILAAPHLQLLSLQKATFGSSSSTAGTTSSSSSATAAAELFRLALAAHPSLAKLELQQANSLSQQDWRQLGAYVAQAPCLQELHLQETALVSDAAASFAAGLQQHQGQLEATSSIALVSALHPGLRVLDLSSCALGAEAAAALGAALGRCCSQLAVLNLGQCELGADGAAGLCGGLAGGCCRLESLDLSGNKIKGELGIFIIFFLRLLFNYLMYISIA
jgi:Ran GTPase-activating protein (RanGAP) involved in mRNA processing and transport